MTCTSVIPYLSSGLAKDNQIMSMFVLFSRFFRHFESMAFLVFKNGGGGGGGGDGTNLTPKQSSMQDVSVNFSKVQQLSNIFFRKALLF